MSGLFLSVQASQMADIQNKNQKDTKRRNTPSSQLTLVILPALSYCQCFSLSVSSPPINSWFSLPFSGSLSVNEINFSYCTNSWSFRWLFIIHFYLIMFHPLCFLLCSRSSLIGYEWKYLESYFREGCHRNKERRDRGNS